MKEEIWLPVSGYEAFYEVSSLGRVRSLHRLVECRPGKTALRRARLMRPGRVGPYLRIELSKDGSTQTCAVHRLVAAAFIPNPENQPVVNHMDGNPLNNSANNLEWCSISHNVRHAYHVLRRCPHFTPLLAHKGGIGFWFPSQKAASAHVGVGGRTIWFAVRNPKRTAGGFHFVRATPSSHPPKETP